MVSAPFFFLNRFGFEQKPKTLHIGIQLRDFPKLYVNS